MLKEGDLICDNRNAGRIVALVVDVASMNNYDELCYLLFWFRESVMLQKYGIAQMDGHISSHYNEKGSGFYDVAK